MDTEYEKHTLSYFKLSTLLIKQHPYSLVKPDTPKKNPATLINS